jgi:anti-sigma28 factor (negative regulator of flagellin synthesis)
MVTMFGIGNIPEPRMPSSAHDKQRVMSTVGGAPFDNVEISAKALEAASIAQLAKRIDNPAQAIRAERVAEAKENVQKGAYKVQEVVLKVAARVDRFL